MRRRLGRLAICTVFVAGLTTLGAGVAGASSGNNTQDVVSVTGMTVTYAACSCQGPAGFWLWSTDTGNPYGNGGQGSIYFYGVVPQRSTEPAQVSDVTISGGTVTEDITANGIACPGTSGAAHGLTAVETSNGQGVAWLSCSLSTPFGSTVATASDAPVTMNISRS